MFPENPELWREVIAPLGALKKYILEDKTNPIASYISPAVCNTDNQMLRVFVDDGALI